MLIILENVPDGIVGTFGKKIFGKWELHLRLTEVNYERLFG